MLYAVMDGGNICMDLVELHGFNVRVALVFDDESDADKVASTYEHNYVQRFHAVRDLPLPEEGNLIYKC